MPRLLIVIVNYRTAALACQCLQTLAGEFAHFPELRVVVVDNASGDESVQQITDTVREHDWEATVTVMSLDHNGGYAFGNNAVVGKALEGTRPFDFCLLLNPDSQVRPGAVRQLVEFMEGQPGVGIAGSRLEDLDGRPQRSAFRFPGVLSELEGALRLGVISLVLSRWNVAPPVVDTVHDTDWVAGTSMIIRREVFEKVGLFDEHYFLYYEEVDFCRRARRRGWRCVYVPASRVIHLVGQSTGISDLRLKAPRRPRYWFESRRRYFLQNCGRARTLAADLVHMIGYCLWRMRRPIQGKPDLDPPHYLWDFFRQSVLCKGFRA